MNTLDTKNRHATGVEVIFMFCVTRMLAASHYSCRHLAWPPLFLYFSEADLIRLADPAQDVCGLARRRRARRRRGTGARVAARRLGSLPRGLHLGS